MAPELIGSLPVRETTEKVITRPLPSFSRTAAGFDLGLLYGLGAYVIWGFIPVYFRAVAEVPPVTILCHRIVWSAVFTALVVTWSGEWRPIRAAIADRRNLGLLSAGALLMAVNWLIFIYSVLTKQLLQASLGYFINPLLSVGLGMIFLHERLRGWQWVAVCTASLAVVNIAWRGHGFPWIAVSLAGSFGFYGLVRKKVNINSLHGLLIESTILVPLALLGWATLPRTNLSSGMLGLLSLSGIVTAVPLLFFGAALRRLKLSTMGFLQYVGPTLQFLVAVVLFHEALDRSKLGSFALCWLAIAIYVADSVVRRVPPPVADEPE
jgi:chloramphenicol-sensitive protein RarD